MSTPPNSRSFIRRHALGLVAIAPIGAAVIGSIFNIWYNVIHVRPLLSAAQEARFHGLIIWNNAAVYPVAVAVWLWIVWSLGPVYRACRDDKPLDDARLNRARARMVNLPLHIAWITMLAWLACIPMFVLGLQFGVEPVHPDFSMHMTVSITIASLINITHAAFIVEILSLRWLYPIFFKHGSPADSRGVFRMTLTRRGVLWAVSAGICPILSLLLLGWVDHEESRQSNLFMMAVGGVGAVFGLISAALLARLVVVPVVALQRAARSVAHGNLDTRVALKRADEFGALIDSFNHMVAEMREKKRLRETFGLHVGEQAAREILRNEAGLGGNEKEITVLFCDIRDFTRRCNSCTPGEAVSVLNTFLTAMVDIVENRHKGMVNKFLGDGFMALFGARPGSGHHALAAVHAGRDMLASLPDLNREIKKHGGVEIGAGIGIHTGPAIIGTIGSSRRLEYTAIGDTVNIASRVEGLTKIAEVPLLFTRPTRDRLPTDVEVVALAPREVKGRDEPIEIFSLSAL